MTSAQESRGDEEFLTPLQARTLLRVSERTFRRYVHGGLIAAAFRLPARDERYAHARYRRSDVEALRARADAEPAGDPADAELAQDAGAARTSLTVTAGVLLTVVLVVGAIRPEVLLGYAHVPGSLSGGLLCLLPMCHEGPHENRDRTWTNEEAVAIATELRATWKSWEDAS